MLRSLVGLAITGALAPFPLQAQEVRIGAGIFFFADQGGDALLSFRAPASRWQITLRHVQWRDTFRDPFTGRELTKTTESRTGPGVDYLFRPEGPGSWYLGGAVLRWSKRETSLVTGEADRATTTVPFLGGGYTRALGRHAFFNLGILLAPGARLSTRTSVSSEDDSGAFDIRAVAGVRF